MSETQADIIDVGPPAYPPGDYAIVELFGHTTIVGRSIYRLTPCSAEIAFKEQPTNSWQLPPAVKVIVPVALLESTTAPRRNSWDDDRDDADNDDDAPMEDEDERPF